jgi:DnaJ-domain-containing protein 1
VATARALKQSERASYQPPPSGQEAKKPEKQPLPRDEALKRLGLTAASSPQEIKATYKALVRKWHPDKHTDADKAAAERRFREVQEAWEALKA